MATIWDFPVTFVYGYSKAYGTTFHTGEDRTAPIGQSVTVNGVEIGKSGNTGKSTGPHTHIGKWQGSSNFNPAGGGATFKSAVVMEIHPNDTDDNGKFVRVQGDGYSWVYLHLDSIGNIKVGQKLEGQQGDPPMNKGDVYNNMVNLENHNPSDLDYSLWVGKTDNQYLNERGFDFVKKQKLNSGDVENMYYHLGEPKPDAEAIKFWTGHYPLELFYAIINSEEYKNRHK